MKSLTLTYPVICKLTGKSSEAVRQDASRGGFDMEDPKSVLIYCAKWAPLRFKLDLVEAMLNPSGAETKRENSKK